MQSVDKESAERGPESTPRSIPSPVDLPEIPDLSHLPAQILHSGTVETLIGQNDDLMARLKVSLRRNSVLEQKIIEQEKTNDDLTQANSSLMSQLQIIQEKGRILREKTSHAEHLSDGLKDQMELLKTKLNSAEGRVVALKAAERYQRRVRAWVTPLIERLRKDLETERKTVYSREAVISDLRTKLSETSMHAQNLESRASRDQARLVEQYETAQKSMSAELEKLRSEVKILREKAAAMDKATATSATAENRIVYLERQNQELQAAVETYRKEAKALAAEAKGREQELLEVRTEATSAREQQERIQDQFESLQAVWAESQKRLEAAKLQHESLNRLNQELSRQLKELRKSPPEANC